MPAITEKAAPISFDFGVRAKKDGKKPPDPFKLLSEMTENDSGASTTATRTASPTDMMSMETFLALMKLGASQTSDAAQAPRGASEAAKLAKRPPPDRTMQLPVQNGPGPSSRLLEPIDDQPVMPGGTVQPIGLT